jgi:multiple sugar transport system substrate-binding protein
MRRRLWVGFLAALVLALPLGACSSQAPSSGPEVKSGSGGNSGGKAEPVSITLSVADYDANMRKDTEALVDQWNKQNADIQVKLVVTNWNEYHDRLTTWVTGNQAPDIANVSGMDFNFFDDMGKLAALDDVLPKEFLANFVAAPLDSMKVKGQLYGLPYFLDPRALYYRKDLFEQAGLKPPETWDDVAAAAKQLTKPGEVYGFAVGGKFPEVMTGLDYRLFTAGPDAPKSHRAGDGKFNVNNPAAVKGLAWLADLVKGGYTNPSPTASEMQADLQPVFISGKLAMIETGSWFWSMIDQEAPKLQYGIARMPVAERGMKSTTLTEPDGIVVFNTTKHKPAVGKFLQFMFSKENRKLFAEQRGVVPERIDVGNDPAYANNWQKKFFVEVLGEAVNRYADMGPKAPEVDQVLTKYMQQVFLGQTDPKTALDKANAEINQLEGR